MSVEHLFQRARRQQPNPPRSRCAALQAASSLRLAQAGRRAMQDEGAAAEPDGLPRPRLSAQALDKLATPLRLRKKAPALVEARSDLELQMQRASELPGPGAYSSPVGMGAASLGGKPSFSTGNAKSALDELISRQAQLPGPGDYATVHQDRGSGGVRWGSAHATASSLPRERQNLGPGPGAYCELLQWPVSLPGGRFSSGHSKTDVEWTMLRAAQLPSPDAYAKHQLPAAEITGGRWSRHATPSELDDLVSRASAIPGPGAYEARPNEPARGGLLQSRTQSALDFLLLQAKDSPSPADTAAPAPPTKGVRVYRPKVKLQARDKLVGKTSDALS